MLPFIPFLCGAALYYLFSYFPAVSVSVAVSASAAAIYRNKYLIIPLLVAGACFTHLRHETPPAPGEISGRELRLTGWFVPGRDTTHSGNAVRTFRPEAAYDEDTGDSIEGIEKEDVTLYSDYAAAEDENYEVIFRAGQDRTRLNPGWSHKDALHGRLISANVSPEKPAFSVIRQLDSYRDRLNRYLLQNFSAESAGLIISLTTGRTDYLSADLKNSFAKTGLAHILSISGSHFGLFSVLLYGIFLYCTNRLPRRLLLRLTLYLSPSAAAALMTLPFMLFYLGLSGGSPPASRSFIMIALFLAGLLAERKGAWLNSLSLAAVILVLWSPGVLMELSFQLSFLAVLFIGYQTERPDNGQNVPQNRDRKIIRFLKNSLGISLAVSLGTAPLVAYHFHYFSLISPVANLIAAPLIGSVLVAGSVISSFAYLITGVYIFKPLVGILAEWSIRLVQLMSGLPYADISIPAFPPALCLFFYGGLLAYLCFGRKKVMLLLPILPLLGYVIASFAGGANLQTTFLDAGQADSAVIQLPDRKTIVIDTGRTGRETAAFLTYSGIRKIDALVLTHDHPDHSGGADHLRQNFEVSELWTGKDESMPDIRSRRLERGDSISGRGYELSVLHPYPEFYTDANNEFIEENNASLVIRLSGQKHSWLFAGDVEDEAAEDLQHLGQWLKSDFIKVPHHGGRSSAHKGFMHLVSPAYAMISAGRGNSFGHPSNEMLELLKDKTVFRTDVDGAVKVTETPDGAIKIKTHRDYRLEKASGIKAELRNIRRLFETW